MGPVETHSFIPEETLTLRKTPSTWALASGGGVLGRAIDSNVDKHRAKDAAAHMEPVLAGSHDLDFRARFWTALDATVASTSWLKIEHVQKHSDYSKGERKTATLPFLSLFTTYELSEDGKKLWVSTTAQLYSSNRGIPDYSGYYDYVSPPIAAAPNSVDAAIGLWASDGAAAYRRCIGEAIEDTMTMIKYDLLSNQAEQSSGTGANETFPCGSGTMCTGHVIWRSENRVIFRHKGDLPSFSSFPLPTD